MNGRSDPLKIVVNCILGVLAHDDCTLTRNDHLKPPDSCDFYFWGRHDPDQVCSRYLGANNIGTMLPYSGAYPRLGQAITDDMELALAQDAARLSGI